MRKEGKNIVFLATTVATFSLVSIPSIKLFFPSAVINLVPVAVFSFIYLLTYGHSSLRYGVKNYYLSVILIFFTICIAIYYLVGKHSETSLMTFFDYFYYLFALFLIILLSPYVNRKQLLLLVMAWAVFLALYNLTIGFSLDRSKGQNYLTYGLPVGAGLTIGLVRLIGTKKWKEKRSTIIVVLLLFAGLLVSQGRASLIFPVMTAIIYLFISMLIRSGGNGRKVFGLIVFGLLLYIVYFVLVQFSFELTLFNRLEAMASDDREEPRIAIWMKTAELISNNLLGYGVNSHQQLLDSSYPHNIFLETFLSFGVFGFAIMAALTILFLYSLITSIKQQDTTSVTVGFLALYFFLCWNISFDLTTSYIPLSLMILTITGSGFGRIKFQRLKRAYLGSE